MMKEPTPEMVAALQAYASRNGRSWKQKLIVAWMNGRDDYEPEGPTLRNIRNNLGPTWLVDKFRLPKTARPYFTLAERIDGRWQIAFGDYDRETVEAELEDYREHGTRKADLRIVRSAETQAAVEAAVAALNA